jgi:hypothetical protein
MATNEQMNLINQTTTMKEEKQMDTRNLIRWAGLSAMAA